MTMPKVVQGVPATEPIQEVAPPRPEPADVDGIDFVPTTDLGADCWSCAAEPSPMGSRS